MGFFDSFKSWFASEAAEVKESASRATSSLESEMDKREAELQASPEQRMEQIQAEIDDDPFASVRDRIDGQQAHAAANEDLILDAEEAEEAGVSDDEAAEALKNLREELPEV